MNKSPHNSDTQSTRIGSGTEVNGTAQVAVSAVIGRDCRVASFASIDEGVRLGDRVTVQEGARIQQGVLVDSDVFVGANVALIQNKFPRCGQPVDYLQTTVHSGASLGANSTVLPGIVVGRSAMVGAGSVVTRDVPPNAIVTGNPARIRGYVGTKATNHDANPQVDSAAERQPILGAAFRQSLKVVRDLRGSLSAAEVESQVPFPIHRCFFVYDVPSKEIRGEHAHRNCEQFLVCVRGSVRVMLDDGAEQTELLLNSPQHGLYIPPMIWAAQFGHTPDTMLVVFASDPYDPDDYIRSYDEFLAIIQCRNLLRSPTT